MLQEPRIQPVVVFCTQGHCDAFFGCKMTQYIQRVLFLPLQMSDKWLYILLPFSAQNEKILYRHCHRDCPFD